MITLMSGGLSDPVAKILHPFIVSFTASASLKDRQTVARQAQGLLPSLSHRMWPQHPHRVPFGYRKVARGRSHTQQSYKRMTIRKLLKEKSFRPCRPIGWPEVQQPGNRFSSVDDAARSRVQSVGAACNSRP